MAIQRRQSKWRKYARRGVKLAGAAAAARYGTSGGIQRLVSDVNYVKGQLNAELKAVDRELSDIPTTTATVRSLNIMAQGSGSSQRDGISVRNKSIQIKGLVGWNSAAAGPIVCRLVLVYDSMPQGGTPDYYAASGNPCVFDKNTTDSFRRLDNVARFKILWSKRVVLTDTYPMKSFNVYKKLNFKSKYYIGQTAGTAATLSSGGLFFMCLSDQAVNGPGVIYDTRLRFIDN